jgi:hypothetical protein
VLALLCELADPPALSVSPASDSVSSVEGRPVPFTCGFEVKPVMGPSSLGADADGFSGVRWPLASADCADGDSCGLNLSLSRSIALSLAARGAAGKNWAKLAPAG